MNCIGSNYVIDFCISGTDLSSCAKLLFVTIFLDVVGKGVVGREVPEFLSPPDEVAVTSSTAAILQLKRAEDGDLVFCALKNERREEYNAPKNKFRQTQKGMYSKKSVDRCAGVL